MPELSAVIIARNEAAVIRRCLDSLRSVADEVVVVDSGSEDETMQICIEWGANVVSRPFDDFVSQKNFAIQQARHDWVLSLDADEALSPQLAGAIRKEMQAPRADAFAVNRLNWYIDRWIRHGGWYPDRKVRLADRRKAAWQGEGVHEKLVSTGTIARLPGDLLHYAYLTTEGHVRKSVNYAAFVAQLRAKAGKKAPAYKLVVNPAWAFFRMYVLKAGFLDGRAGFQLAKISAFEVFMRYAFLREHARKAPAAPGSHP